MTTFDSSLRVDLGLLTVDTNTKTDNSGGNVKAAPLMIGKMVALKDSARFSPASLGLVLLIHALLLAILLHLAQDTPPVTMPETPMMVSLLSEVPMAPVIEQQEPQPTKPEPLVHKQKPIPKPVQVVKQPPTPLPKVSENIAPSPIESPSSAETKPSAVIDVTPVVIKAPEVAEKPAPKEEVVEPPRFGVAYLNNPKPNYPGLSRRVGEQGRVLFKVLVNANGEPDSVEIAKSSGFERLDQAGLEAVKQWRFVPAKKNNQAINAYVIVPISFSLDR